MQIRTRFAPSPTGYLHIGSARTALYSWLFAKKNNGIFILRFEDTDFERSTESSVKGIINGLNWLKLSWDEGPYFQSKKLKYYIEIIHSMLSTGCAYRCYCSEVRLQKVRKYQIEQGKKPKYDGKCRTLSNNIHVNNSSYVVRFKNPEKGQVIFQDQIRGKIVVNNSELDDLIILRSNGIPTYNFCVVIDDRDMDITHVIRGEDHINNTPRQINILKALGAKIPLYAHVSMIIDIDGKKLSKRNNVIDVMKYCKLGYLPEAILNYILRLGWSHGDQEIFSIKEMKELFTLDNVGKSSSCFNIKKLLWFNHYYINSLPIDYIIQCLKSFYTEARININNGPNLNMVVPLVRNKCKTLNDVIKLTRFFYEECSYLNNKIIQKYLNNSSIFMLKEIKKQIETLSIWQVKNISLMIHALSDHYKVSIKEVAMPLRIAITGTNVSPSIDMTIYVLGRYCVLKRINNALEYIYNN
ncbi:glutamate--tRNA ligase [Buchnera aphidicola (Formosaphis micheliae)]|uniref:glutamate--tRNA ligase n=1 Tax=Buchnera aphidicola TaxID=9 RepID=UPI0031B8A5E6